MKLDVPYYSQFVDIQDPFWMLRACGATSLKMVLEFHGKVVPDIVTLCNEAKERGGYHMANGWVHDYLVKKAQELGLQAYRKEGLTSLDEIKASLDAGNPVVVSVEKRVLEQKRFHIIVIVGYDTVAEDRGTNAEGTRENAPSVSTNSSELIANSCLYYHEPESTDKEKGKYHSCDEATFMEYFRGKAIFFTK